MLKARFFKSPLNTTPPHAEFLEQNEVHVFPGLQGRLKQSLQVGEKIRLDAGTNLIIQPLNRHKSNERPKFKLTTFVRDTSGLNQELPESKRAIKTDASYEKEIDLPDEFFEYHETLLESKDPLFVSNNSPRIQDIVQNQFPDCFLLSAIQSILNHPDGKDFIRGMMHDNKDGTVTVRLFDPKFDSFRYIRVPKAIHATKEGAINLHKELWVHILENAYIAVGLNSINSKADQSSGSVFAQGDQIHFALTILTGLKNEELIKINERDTSMPFLKVDDLQIEPLSQVLAINSDEQRKNALIAIMGKEYTTLSKLVMTAPSSSQTPGYSLEDALMAYYKFYLANAQACKNIINNNELSQDHKISELKVLVNVAHLEQQDLVVRFLTDLFNFYIKPLENDVVMLPTRSFSGYYTPDEMNLFKAISKGLREGALVNASSKQGIKAIEQPGIRGTHAYTVLDLVSRDETILDSDLNQLKTRLTYYVVLRNPWGSTGRIYEPLTFKPMEDEKADTFLIELSDFYQNYHDVSISQSANLLFTQAKMVNQMEALTERCHANEETKLDELVNKRSMYSEYQERRLSLEQMHLNLISPEDRTVLKEIFEHPLELSHIKRIFLLTAEDREVKLPFYLGSKNEAYEHVFNLLRLEWLQENDEDPEEIHDLKQQIIQNSKYSFSPMMDNNRVHIDILCNSFYRLYMTKLFDLKNVMNEINQKIEEIDAAINEFNLIVEEGLDSDEDQEEEGLSERFLNHAFEQQRQGILNYYQSLKDLADELLEMEQKIENLGAPIDKATLAQILAQVRALPEKSKLSETRRLFTTFGNENKNPNSTNPGILQQDARHLRELSNSEGAEETPNLTRQESYRRRLGILAQIIKLFMGISRIISNLMKGSSSSLNYQMPEGSIESPLKNELDQDDLDVGNSLRPK